MAMNEFTRLCVDTANHKVQNYTVEDANTSIRNKFYEVMGVSKDCTRKELRRAIERHTRDIYDLIEDTLEVMIETGWGENPFFKQFVEEKNIGVGDENSFYVDDNSLLTVSKFSGNHHDLIRQKLGAGETFSVPMSWYGIKIYADFEQMMTGAIDWATFVQKIYEAMDNKINSMLYPALMDADNSLPSDVDKTGTITEDTIIEVASTVSAMTGKDVAFVGTRPALMKLCKKMGAEWISEKMKDERNTTGVVGYIEGYKALEVKQVFDAGTRKPVIDNNKVLVLPISPDFKPIKIVNGGEARFFETTDPKTNMDYTIEAEYAHKLGCAVVMNMIYGRLKNIQE